VSWWVPTELPDDLTFRHAVDWPGQFRQLTYGGGVCSIVICERSVNVVIYERAGVASDQPVTDTTELTWSEQPAGLTAIWGGHTVEVTGQGVSQDELAAIAASTRLLPETALLRTPLVCCPFDVEPSDPGPVVAGIEVETSGGVERWDLHVYTDGDQFALSGYNQSDETPGPFYRVSEERPIALGGRPGFYTRPRLPEGTGLITGVAHPDVATIDFVLADGQTISYEPVDQSGLFYENFIFLTIPFPQDAPGADLSAQLLAAVARDTAGTELFRCDSWEACILG
jgi:hypothetical protein